MCGLVHVCFCGYHFVPEKIYFYSVFLQIRTNKATISHLAVADGWTVDCMLVVYHEI